MRISWVQPSLSRDFTLLSVAILFVLGLISGWVTYQTYERHYERVTTDLGKESARIERMLSAEFGDASYMLASLGRQIAIDSDHNDRDYTKLAQSLKSFDSKNHIYSILSWVNTDKKMVVSSNRGVLEEPVDISDRDFIQKSAVDSWKMHIGRPIDGRVSGRWVIPVAMGITDSTGKFIGIIAISIDIGVLTEQFRDLVKRDGVSFAVMNRDASKELVTLTEVSDHSNFISDNFSKHQLDNIDFDKNIGGLISKGSLVWGSGIYTYYRISENFPYIILMGYDANYSDVTVRTVLWSRLLQLLVIAVFFVLFLWIVRVRVISPVLDVTAITASITRGEKFSPLAKKGSLEIEDLVSQVKNVSEYIDETRRIEVELRNKMFLLKKAKENAEFNVRSKSEFLAYIAQEMRVPLNNIIGFSQVLKDQVYGAIENRKYKQYAADIYAAANQLITKIQDILLYSKIDNGYIALQENNLEITAVINAALRQVSDKLHDSKISVKVNLHEPLPKLHADEFRLQQIIINLLLVALGELTPDSVITLDVEIINEYRDKQFLAFIINTPNIGALSQDDLQKIVEKLFFSTSHGNSSGNTVKAEHPDLRLEITRVLTELHGGALHINMVGDEASGYIAFFPASRLVFQD